MKALKYLVTLFTINNMGFKSRLTEVQAVEL